MRDVEAGPREDAEVRQRNGLFTRQPKKEGQKKAKQAKEAKNADFENIDLTDFTIHPPETVVNVDDGQRKTKQDPKEAITIYPVPPAFASSEKEETANKRMKRRAPMPTPKADFEMIELEDLAVPRASSEEDVYEDAM
jgi:hypothetical protein